MIDPPFIKVYQYSLRVIFISMKLMVPSKTSKLQGYSLCIAKNAQNLILKCLHTYYILLALLVLTLSSCSTSEPDVIVQKIDPRGNPPSYRWCTQICFTNHLELVVDNQNNRILFRPQGQTKFTATSIPLKRPHSILYNPYDKLYYVADTGNNRIVAFDDLEAPTLKASTSQIAHTQLVHPHDITIDFSTGWLYTLNPHATIILRFKAIGKEEQQLDISNVLGYSRALSFINGQLYVAGSSYGKIVEITDFEKGLYIVHQAPGKVRVSAAGNWKRTGLIPNDIANYHGYWYVSSYFCPAASLPGQDYNKNKLIRFKTWEQFTTGNWEDLSQLLPDKLVPYYFTVHDDQLYITLFNHLRPGKGDCIYRFVQQ